MTMLWRYLLIVTSCVFVSGDDCADCVTTWLPREVQPLHYTLKIMPILDEGNFTAPGELTMKFRVLTPTHRIVLNVRDLIIDEASVEVEQESGHLSFAVIEHQYDVAMETYTVIVNRTMTSQNPIHRITMRYVAKLKDNLRGLYRTHYVDDNGELKWLAMSLMNPTNARAVFPCMDEPIYKARFTVSIGRRKQLKSLANMPLQSTQDIEGMKDWVWDHYEESVPMATYLVAIAVFDFARFPAPSSRLVGNHNVTFGVWARPSQVHKGWYAADVGPKILDYYSQFFDLPYPLPKQDMVATPQLFYEAMENWGMITFREPALLVDPTSPASKYHVARTVAHELAHQWFGNLVTMKWWNDVWLNEGFATYVSQVGLAQVEPQWRSEDKFVLDTVQRVMEIDSFTDSHPVSAQVYRVQDIDNIFDKISYNKGSSIIRMMSHFLGNSVFHKGINLYLRRHSFGSASQDDLWTALTQAARELNVLPDRLSVKKVMDTWTLQTGFPVVTVMRDYARGTAQIQQSRFILETDPHDVGFKTMQRCCWWIPLWIDTPSASRLEWMSDSPKQNVTNLPGSGSEWIIFNSDRRGFYRVNYDEQNWELIRAALPTLGELTRAALLDDALNLARAGLVKYPIALHLADSLRHDTAALPWAAAIPLLSEIRYLLQDLDTQKSFQLWSRDVVSKVYTYVLQLSSSTNPVEREHLDLILSWACNLELPDCLDLARIQYQEWRTSGETFPSLLCSAIAHGEKSDWELVLHAYHRTEDPRLFGPLGCSKDPSQLERVLSLLLPRDSKKAPFAAAGLFYAVTENINARGVAFSFLINNWSEMQTHFPDHIMRIMIEDAARSITSEYQLHQLKAAIPEMMLDRELKRALQRGRQNVWWLNHNGKKVAEWLKLRQHPAQT